MKKKDSLINRMLQHTREPRGFWGRIMLRGMNRGHAGLSNWGMARLEWRKDWNVLDIGCGGGANIHEMLRRCREGTVYGIDPSVESIAFSRKKNRKQLGLRCEIQKGRADKIPYGNASFDIVTAFETVYFWGDLAIAFREVARVLRPGGIFLICNHMADPSDTTWTKRIDGMVMHSAESLESVLLSSGFTKVEIYRKGISVCLKACL